MMTRGKTKNDKEVQTDETLLEQSIVVMIAPEEEKAKKRKYDYEDEDEEKYYRKLPKKQKQEIDKIEQEIQQVNKTNIPLRFKILESKMDIKLKSLAISKLDQLYNLDPSSGEYSKLTHYIESLCKIPIGKYDKMSISAKNTPKEIGEFLDATKKRLNDTVYGHDDAKHQIIRLLAKWISNPEANGLVIGIQGDMGTGKTKLCKDGICQALGLPFGFVTLGGINDGSHLVGFNYTYEGSRWGRIADILMKAQCMNPVFFFDELDKISTTRHGEEIVNILIHLTDTTQNDKFHDKYFSDVDFDLSKCLIVFSYNNEELINPILRDRMVTIKTSGYTYKDKVSISKFYMLPEIFTSFGFTKEDLLFDNDVLSYIIGAVDEEKGVRNLKRGLEEIISQINLQRLLDKDITFPYTVTRETCDKFLSKKKKDSWVAQSMYL
jgi:ATP-dependent Lon protease